MTTVRIFENKTEGTYRAFEFFGHAGYGRNGKDIVCSAISILAFTTIESIENIVGDDISVDSDEKSGLIRCTFCKEPSKEAILLVDSMLLGLKKIRDEYGKKFIDIIFEEV